MPFHSTVDPLLAAHLIEFAAPHWIAARGIFLSEVDTARRTDLV
jgi:hypothetical protein